MCRHPNKPLPRCCEHHLRRGGWHWMKHMRCRLTSHTSVYVQAPTNFFFFDLRKPYFLKNIFCESMWANKTLAVPSSYKRCTSWLELETCCADLKLFAITPHPLRPINYPLHVHFNPYLAKIGCAFVSILNLIFKILIVLN